ncbi:MAG: ATP-dependent helicase [Candidatus Omnitrophota bacterium]
MKKYVLHEPTGEIKTHIDFKGNLNQQQYEVVTGAEGPCLVLAGAGSGKTRTLIYRLAYLLERGVSPKNILLMTFTNKAAREMRDRAEMLLRYKPKGGWNGTFHHVGNRTLRMYAQHIGYKKDFGILDEHDSRDLVKSCMGKQEARVKEERFPKASIVRSIISFSVNTKKTIEDVLEEKYPYFLNFTRDIEEIRKTYDKKKKQSNNMDYDDLLVQWKLMLETVPAARKRFTDQFLYILVDEYQDTNFLQADIIDILAERHKNVLVVGDDAQSIYSFRGARVDNILQFPKRFSDAKIFKLETNYRSTPEILGLANDSLKHNEKQFYKELKAVNEALEKPGLVEVKDLYTQASFVVQRILEMREEGLELKDVAVLFRAHYQSAELQMELVKRNIPYIVRGGIRFFEQAHIKDILSYLKIVTNSTDEISWMRALTLCPGIGPGYASRIFEHFLKNGSNLKGFLKTGASGSIPKKAQGGYTRFLKIMRAITRSEEETPGEMINLIMESGYETHILANFENAKDRIDDIHELVNFSHDYTSMQDFLNDITLRESFRGETVLGEREEDEFLVISTIHQAKGLEWDAVMIIGLCEGQFPHPKAMKDISEIEEERRLFYVASTRAKKYLYLIHPATRFDYQMGTVVARRSRFLEELDSKNYEVWEVSSGNSGSALGDTEITFQSGDEMIHLD